MSEFVEETKFQYYAINADKKLVYGFDDLEEAKRYCNENKLKMNSRLTLRKNKIDINDLNNWADDYPEF